MPLNSGKDRGRRNIERKNPRSEGTGKESIKK